MNRRMIFIGIGGVALIVALWLVYRWSANRTRSEYSGTVETREIQVGSKVGGRVIAVPVEEGQLVKAGSLLVRFEADELRAQRDQAAAAVVQAQAELDRMTRGNRPEEIEQAEATARAQREAWEAAKNGPRRQELEQARADYAAAKADAVNAQSLYSRTEKLEAADIVSRQQFDDARDKRDAAAQRAESARQRLALLQAGTRVEDLQASEARSQQAQAAAVLARKGFRKEDIDAARGKLVESQGHVTELDVRLREAELTTPSDAIIEVVSTRPGDLVPAGRIVVTLLEASQLWVKVYVPETQLAHVHVGQKAEVRIDALSGRVFNGHVGQVASNAEFLPRNVQTHDDREHQVFGVKVFVDNPQGILKSGMSATVRLQ